MIIDGKEYVLKEDTDNEISKSKNFNGGLFDESNVILLLSIPDTLIEKDIIKIPKPNMTFKKLCKIEECKTNMINTVFYVGENKYTNSYLIMFDKIIKILSNSKDKTMLNFDVYQGIDLTGTTLKDYPMLLVYDKYGCIIAPRVDT